MPHIARNRPETFLERVLDTLWHAGIGSVSRSAQRKLARRYKKRAEADFDAYLNEVKPGDIVLDLGANHGVYTKKLAATGAEVHAFEPDPDTFEKLKAEVGHLANVSLYQQAVGARSGTVTLMRMSSAPDPTMDLSVGSSVVFRNAQMDMADCVEVEQISLFDLIAGFVRPVRLIKMDIEGSETDILKEMLLNQRLDGFDALFVETHENLVPEDMPFVLKARELTSRLDHPHINLFWL